MEISVIIPTLNAGKNISNLILALQNQSLIPKEIIIIDSSSTDNTVKIAKEHRCYAISIEKTSFDHGATRNLGAKLASGEILIFMTQDAIPVNNRLFENLIAPLNNNEELNVASFARQTPFQNANPIEKLARLFNYPDTLLVKSKDDLAVLGTKTFFFSNVCSAIKKQAFKRWAVSGKNNYE